MDRTPLFAIELDDHSHDTEARKLRDAEVERMLEEAQLPLLRITNYKNLSRDEIERQIIELL